MNALRLAFVSVYAAIVALFLGCGIYLVGLVVVVVALAVESLIAVFHFAQDAPEHLPDAAAIAVSAAALLAAWGVFVRLNRSVEELEPEGMSEAKREDAKVQ